MYCCASWPCGTGPYFSQDLWCIILVKHAARSDEHRAAAVVCHLQTVVDSRDGGKSRAVISRHHADSGIILNVTLDQAVAELPPWFDSGQVELASDKIDADYIVIGKAVSSCFRHKTRTVNR